jgi:hypothetical protein
MDPGATPGSSARSGTSASPDGRRRREGSRTSESGKKSPEEMTTREKIWALLDDPRSSSQAWWFSWTISALILASAISFVLETVPAYERYQIWWVLEAVFMIVFSLEIAARFLTFPGTNGEFWDDFMNVIDVVSVMPFYVMLFFHQEMVDTRILRIIRLVRIFKFGRYYEPLLLITETFSRSLFSLCLCVFFMLVGIIFFATLLWFLEKGTWNHSFQCYRRELCTTPERGSWSSEHGCFMYTDAACSPFQSIPTAFWWAITTMTTVGYGDTYPVTGGGRTVAAFAMVSGILCVALPTTILAVEFADKYQVMLEQKKAAEIQRSRHKMSPEQQALCSELKELANMHQRMDVLLPRLAVLAAAYAVHGAEDDRSSAFSETTFDKQVQDSHEALSRMGGRALFSIKEYRSKISHYVPELCA